MPHLRPVVTRPRGHLHVPATCLAELLAEGWRRWPDETGGLLLGRTYGDLVCVTEVVGPGPAASHEPRTFTPDSDWQAAQAADAWRRDRSVAYLGDWHTHPRGSTRLSALDVTTAQQIADAPQARRPSPVMVVAALSGDGTVRVGASRLRSAGRMSAMTVLVR